MITYKSTKLSTKIFRVVYRNKCPDEGCKDDYIGKTNSIIVERIQYHNIKGKKRAGFSGVHEGFPLYVCSQFLFCNYFEELQTMLFEVELIINNAPLTYFNLILSKHV